MIYVIGGTGFVGSAYGRLLASLGLEHRIITRANRGEFAGTSCDVLINANGNSKKFLADQQPTLDFDMSVRSVMQSLVEFRFSTYVLLSSGDVYPDQSRPDRTVEDQHIDPSRVSRYGQHKLIAEQLVRGSTSNWLIMRMGGFVGPGLKKNAIYDLVTGEPVWVAPETELQFISTDRGAQIVWALLNKGIRREVVNLGAVGVVNIGALRDRMSSRSEFKPLAPKIRYELNLDKLSALYDETLPSSQDEVEDFLARRQRNADPATPETSR